jgi:hypothetical protein
MTPSIKDVHAIVRSFCNQPCREHLWRDLTAADLEAVSHQAREAAAIADRFSHRAYVEVADHAAWLARIRRLGLFQDLPVNPVDFMQELARRGVSAADAIAQLQERFPAGPDLSIMAYHHQAAVEALAC